MINGKQDLINHIDSMNLRAYCKKGLKDSVNRKWLCLVSHEMSNTGAPIALFNLAVFLKKKGYLPVVFTTVDGKLSRRFEEANIPVIVFPKLYHTFFLDECSLIFEYAVVNTIVGAPLIRKVNGNDFPVIWWLHESDPLYLKEWLVQMPVRLYNNIHVFCVGHFAEKALLSRRPEYCPENLLFYCNDFSLTVNKEENCFSASQNNGRTVFLNVASVEYNKGQDIILKAFDLLEDTDKRKVCLYFVGREGEKEQTELLKEYAERNPENIKYLNEQEQEKIFEMLWKADCYICASRYDSMPVSVIEAAISSKPVICSQNTGVTPLVEKYDAGFVFEEDSPEKLAECIRKLLVQRDNIDEKGKNARRLFEENFSEKIFEKRFTEIEEMINERNRK